MSSEVLLLCVLGGMTCLGYMIAINSQGSTKLIISYLLATLLLAGTVLAIIQHVKIGIDRVQQQEYKRLEREKQDAEQKVKSQEENIQKNKKFTDAASKLNSFVVQGTGFASTMMSVDLKDFSVELSVLLARAVEMKKASESLLQNYASFSNEIALFPQEAEKIHSALKNIDEAAKNYKLYFKSEDASQESAREKIMRQKAREAYDQLKEASAGLAAPH